MNYKTKIYGTTKHYSTYIGEVEILSLTFKGMIDSVKQFKQLYNIKGNNEQYNYDR